MDAEQKITQHTLQDIALALQDRREVPPRLIFRAMVWAQEELIARDRMIADARKALEETAE